jgi:RNA polymerase sigma-70 factor (ECF subfamily)
MGTFAIRVRPHTMPQTTTDDSDEALVRRAQRGNAEAFSQLVRRHQHTVYSLALRYMREPVLAEDMAQEAFLKGYRLLRGFRGDCRFTTWMYRVTCSVCLTELAKRGRRGEVPMESAGAERGYEENPAGKDAAEIVRRCVTQLPERFATIVTMYYLDQAPYEEIAAAMEIPVGTLKTWMFRARKELRALVEKELGAHDARTI